MRVPFTFAVQPGTGRLFINDVGGHPNNDESVPQWEEINEGIAGANYGWPYVAGPATGPPYTSPVYSYGHGETLTTGCAITGAAFYNPKTAQYPSQYVGNYFFADYCSGWIDRMDANSTVTNFATGIAAPVSLEVGVDGSLYYLARDSGSVRKICYGHC